MYVVIFTVVISYSIYEWGGSCYVYQFFSTYSHLAKDFEHVYIYEVMSVGC